ARPAARCRTFTDRVTVPAATRIATTRVATAKARFGALRPRRVFEGTNAFVEGRRAQEELAVVRVVGCRILRHAAVSAQPFEAKRIRRLQRAPVPPDLDPRDPERQRVFVYVTVEGRVLHPWIGGRGQTHRSAVRQWLEIGARIDADGISVLRIRRPR